MSPQDIIDALSDYGFTDTTSIRKMEKINSTIFDMTTREPWPFMEADPVLLDFDGTNAAPTNMPSDFQADIDLVDLATYSRLQPMRMQEADRLLNAAIDQPGTARYYYFIGRSLRLAPIPPAGTGTHRLRYIKVHPAVAETDPESAILIPKEHHEVVLLGALSKLYDMEDDTDLSVRFQQLYEKAYSDMRGSIWMRQYDRPDHIVTTDPYDYIDFYA